MADDSSDGMDDRPDADRSSAEMRQLMRKLDPSTGGTHKDRVRRINKFRSYMDKNKEGYTPEFFDDDLPLLLLGSQAPEASSDEELQGQKFYGLLQACGTPSNHDNKLKRSARPAMTLLRYLCLDWQECEKGQPVIEDLNRFAKALCSLDPEFYKLMQLEIHMEGDKRGGALNDACSIIVLICSKHLKSDGFTVKPIKLDDVLLTEPARMKFNEWLKSKNATSAEQKAMVAIEKLLQIDDHKRLFDQSGDGEEEESESEEEEEFSGNESGGEGVGDKFDGDILQAFKRRHRTLKQKIKIENKRNGKRTKRKGAAVRWDESDAFQILEAKKLEEDSSRVRSVQGTQHSDSQEATAERAKNDEIKANAHKKDPLQIRKEKSLDLGKVQKERVGRLVESLKEMDEKMNKIEQEREKNANMDKETQEGVNQKLRNLEAQKESLESVLDLITAIGSEDKSSEKSIIPTDPNFCPILFLTLIHRDQKYEVLNESMEKLSNQTSNQADQLQTLVMKNFALFVRCADGIDVFDEANGYHIGDNLKKLENFALSCSDQAKKSFKPLLDNTNEVRKVQSALSVLQRIGPILQAPHLMRQHLENGRFGEALTEYKKVLVIDDLNNIDLLNHVKGKAVVAAREARRELENRLAQDKVSKNALMDGIRDLNALLGLDVPEGEEDDTIGKYDIGDQTIDVREHPPALACLILQAAHFKVIVQKTIDIAEKNASRIYNGETLSAVQASQTSDASTTAGTTETASTTQPDSDKESASGAPRGNTSSGNQWKYDVLDGRVIATIKAVTVIRTWLPRLLDIGKAARDEEKHRAARVGRRQREIEKDDEDEMSAFQVFLRNISPDVHRLVEHATFCALGSTSRSSGSKEVKMSFGKRAPEKLRTLLKSPLPPTQSSKCAKELANLVTEVNNAADVANTLRPTHKDFFESSGYEQSPLDDCKQMAVEAVVTVERRRCIFAFDVCARTCSSRASGSGRFDGEALFKCLQTLLEELTRSEECSSEIEKGCELVVRRCCEGLASYVRDRGDSARLRAVAECADAMSGSLVDVVKEVEYTNKNSTALEDKMEDDVKGLESAMFDEYLDNVRENVAGCCRIGWLDMDTKDDKREKSRDTSASGTFPAYLSASLLAIVRCRAQVERALGEKKRRGVEIKYQFLAMATAADGVMVGICNEIKQRKTKMKVRQADRMANELQFLMNVLMSFLSDETLAAVDATRRTLVARAGRKGVQGDGPDGLAAIEELERLGRVYVMCLGETTQGT